MASDSLLKKIQTKLQRFKQLRKKRQLENLKKQCSDFFSQLSEDIRTVIDTKPDYVVQIHAGLGNQMFQYAFSRALPGKVLYDISELGPGFEHQFGLDKFCMDLPCVKNALICEAFRKKNMVVEKVLNKYDPDLITGHSSGYFKGFFQSEKYFKPYREELVKVFRPRMPFDQSYQSMLDQIRNTNSVLVNFRVGADYRRMGWVIDDQYQKKAMDWMAKHISNPRFFVFADDIDWVKRHFKTGHDVTFVDLGSENPNRIYFDLELIKNCKHDIVVNSTYSWWGAWLNENPEKIVIAPSPWFIDPESCRKFNSTDEDALPDEWIKLNIAGDGR